MALPAGTTALDLRGLRLEVPPALAAIQERLARLRVLFDVGSAVPSGDARATIERVADAFGRLESGAAALGAHATLELVGRTDPTGSDATNQELSRGRADAVLRLLAGSGISRAVTSTSAVGTSRPLAAEDPAERARINRSVSFQVSLGVEPGREPR